MSGLPVIPAVRSFEATGGECALAPTIEVEVGADEALDSLGSPIGLAPDPDAADERYRLIIETERIRVRAPHPAGLARGKATVEQLTRLGRIPCGHVVDGPRYSWRGLSFDVARHFFPVAEIRRVIDLLALYKLNVLHLHLTDDQAWNLDSYTAGELKDLVSYASERFVTLLPEVDMPGHTGALIKMHPELLGDRNTSAVTFPGGYVHEAVWLDPGLPATFEVVEQVFGRLADMFPSPYLHFGGDEPLGIPGHAYMEFVQRVRDIVRQLGRRPVGWQESARAGLGPGDVIQYWIAGIRLPTSLPKEFQETLDPARSDLDVEMAAAAGAHVILSPASHCYLDVPYADPVAEPAQANRHGRLGMRFYPPKTVEESFAWAPALTAPVGGIEAAIWAESIREFDDLTFLLLPRLPGIAEKAWAGPGATWAEHRERLSRHRGLWDEDGLVYFSV